MKKGIFISVYDIVIIKIPVVIFMLFSLTGKSHSQTIIFKKDSTTLRVTRIDTTGEIRSYSLSGDPEGTVHWISKNSLDSIHYRDGKTEKFTWPVYKPETEKINPQKNFIGTKIFPLFYSKPNFYYERLIIKENVGLKICYLFSTTDDNNLYYGTLNEKAEQYISTGLNYYFLQSAISRFGTGLTFLTGKFYEEYYDNLIYNIGSKSYSGLIWNINFSYILLEKIYTSLTATYPIGWNSSFSHTYIELELSLNF